MEKITVKQYRLTANGLELVGEKQPLKIGTKIFANLSNTYDICAVISEPDQYGNQKIVCMDKDTEYRTTSLFYKLHYKHTEPISKKFGIGYYWDDKENKVFSSQEIQEAIENAKNFEKVLEDRANEKEFKRLQLVEQLKKEYSFLELKGNEYDNNVRKKNLVTLLKRTFPETKFSVKKDSWDCYGISWTNGAAEEEVDKIIKLFSDHEFDSSGDFYDYEPSEFNRLFGGFKYLSGNRSFSEDIEEIRKQFWGYDEESEWKRRKSNRSLRNTNIPKNYNSVVFDLEKGYIFK